MYLAGDAAGELREQINASTAKLRQRHAPMQRRMLLLEGEHEAGITNAGARQSADRASRDRVDADVLAAEIDREITYRCFERGFRHAHHVVIRHRAVAA